jgi:RNA polymerase sigma factor (sigma-70 family)
MTMARSKALGLVHDGHLAEDVAADAFLAGWRLYKEGRFDPSRGKFSTVVVSIAMKRGQTAYRRAREYQARMMPSANLAALAAPAEHEHSGPASPLEAEESDAGWARFLAALEQALLRLSPRLREVFQMRFLKGKSTMETADALGLTQNAVRQRSFRASKALAEDEELHRAALVLLDF